MDIVVDWNGKDLPAELKELPPGRYHLAPLDDGLSLTAEEEAGLYAAMDSVARGAGVPMDQARDLLEARLRR